MLAAGCGIVVPDSYYNAKPEAPHANPRRKTFPNIRADGLRRISRENQIDTVIHSPA